MTLEFQSGSDQGIYDWRKVGSKCYCQCCNRDRFENKVLLVKGLENYP